jgi:hypothetical protein
LQQKLALLHPVALFFHPIAAFFPLKKHLSLRARSSFVIADMRKVLKSFDPIANIFKPFANLFLVSKREFCF